jgi:membrane protein YdbS with pleckstrin-like domain
MIALNSPQGLPPNAIVYMALRSLAAALFLALIATLARLSSSSPNFMCRGALCGTHPGGLIAVLLYLYAAGLMLRTVLNYKWLSFVLTDKSISIESGVLVRNSCTFRYERIQDIDTYQDPLHRMLGLKSVALWTSPPGSIRSQNQKAERTTAARGRGCRLAQELPARHASHRRQAGRPKAD